MKYILTALSALVICSSVQAQTDTKAQSILQAASKKMSALKSLKANFAITRKGSPKQTGTFLLKGQKYKVSMPQQEIISDGRTVWTYVKGANEVQITNQSNDQAMSPAKLFTNFYDKEYTYRYLGTRTVAGKACEVIEMVPNNKSRQFSKIELAIDKTNTIAGGTVYEKNGQQYLYEVSGFTPNAAVTDAQFTFDPKAHPGVEVVDLR